MAVDAEHAGDFDTALALIDSAMAKKPGELAYQIPSYRIRFECGAMLVHHAIKLRNHGNLKEALKELEKATTIDPASDQARQELNRTKKMIERNEKGENGEAAPSNDQTEDLRTLTPADREKRKEAGKDRAHSAGAGTQAHQSRTDQSEDGESAPQGPVRYRGEGVWRERHLRPGLRGPEHHQAELHRTIQRHHYGSLRRRRGSDQVLLESDSPPIPCS